MEILQTFESIIISREDEHLALSSIFVPTDVSNFDCFENIGEAIAEALGSTEWFEAREEDQIPIFIALGLEREAFVLAVGEEGYEGLLREPKEENISDERSLEFAREVFFQPLIPLTQSPLKLDSLSNLVRYAGVGATVGFIAVMGCPMVLITVPAGIILCGAAKGIGKALSEGFREQILLFFRKHKQ